MAALIRGTLNNRYLPRIEFTSRASYELGDLNRGGPLRRYDRADVPEEAVLQSPHKALPEFLPITGILSVSREAKDLIEAFEPGLHQFLSVSIRRERGDAPILRLDGSVLDAPYYVLVPGVQLDAVWIEKSDVRVLRMGTIVLGPQEEKGMVLRRSMTMGHHFWSGGKQLGPNKFFSDELAQAVLDRKWKGLEIRPVREE